MPILDSSLLHFLFSVFNEKRTLCGGALSERSAARMFYESRKVTPRSHLSLGPVVVCSALGRRFFTAYVEDRADAVKALLNGFLWPERPLRHERKLFCFPRPPSIQILTSRHSAAGQRERERPLCKERALDPLKGFQHVLWARLLFERILLSLSLSGVIYFIRRKTKIKVVNGLEHNGTRWMRVVRQRNRRDFPPPFCVLESRPRRSSAGLKVALILLLFHRATNRSRLLRCSQFLE